MTRKEELLAIFEMVDDGQKAIARKLIEEMVFQEERLEELKKLPFIRVHPKNPSKQESTPAQRQYKELSQSYANIARILLAVLRGVESADKDPVAEFLEKMKQDA